MKVIETAPTKIIERKYLSKTVCDFCKNEIVNNGYQENEVLLEGKIGSFYPEGDLRELYILDACSDCFLDKIKPVIEHEFSVEFRKLLNEDRDESFE